MGTPAPRSWKSNGERCFREEGGVKSAAGEDGDVAAGCHGVLLRKGYCLLPHTESRGGGGTGAGSAVVKPFAEY